MQYMEDVMRQKQDGEHKCVSTEFFDDQLVLSVYMEIFHFI